jgi:hypothetical protein
MPWWGGRTALLGSTWVGGSPCWQTCATVSSTEAARDGDTLVPIGHDRLGTTLLAVLCHERRINEVPLGLRACRRMALPVSWVTVSRSSRALVGSRVVSPEWADRRRRVRSSARWWDRLRGRSAHEYGSCDAPAVVGCPHPTAPLPAPCSCASATTA